MYWLQGRFIHKAEEAEASGPTKPRGPQSLRAHKDQYYLFSNSPLNHSSQPLPLSCGGPQSSVLGPLLFIRYTTPIKPFQNRIHHNRHICPNQENSLPFNTPNCYSTTFTFDAPLRNLGVTFDPHLSFSNHISNLSSSCFTHIRDIRRIQPMHDFKIATSIATSIVHSKLDCSFSIFLNIDSTQIQCLQLIQNSLALAVTRTPVQASSYHSCP